MIIQDDLGKKFDKTCSTQYSRVVPHHSTDWAVPCLTSEIRRDPVFSGAYGRIALKVFSSTLSLKIVNNAPQNTRGGHPIH